MKAKEVKMLNSYIEDIEIRSLHISDEEYLEKFKNSKYFEIELKFDGMTVNIKDIPKVIGESLLRFYLADWQLKVLQAKNALCKAGIELEDN